jgi:phosphoglycerate dehydrogenase-like enzyme
MKIVFHGENAGNFRKGFEALVTEAHEIVDLSDALDRPGEREHFETAEVIVGVKLSAQEPLPRALRLYHAPAAGTDAIDTTRLPAGALLCNAFGHEDAIAEYVMTALLMRHVPLPRADARLRDGHWDYWAGRPGALRTELGSQTLGLVGYGHIGKAIARRAKAFGMRVLVANRSRPAPSPLFDAAFGLDKIEAVMAGSDTVVLSLPLTSETRGFIDARALGAMKPDGVILNVGRGPVIDENALYEALSQERIGGAIIDTWYRYPAPDAPVCQPGAQPFRTLTNLVMTPHMSGWTDGTVRRRQETIADNITRLMADEPLVNVVARIG